MSKFQPYHDQIAKWAKEGMTLQYMADQIGGVTLGGVRKYCISVGIEYTKKRGWRAGSHKGEDHHSWKGGKHCSGDYVRTKADGHPHADCRGMMAEHRLVMEQKLGRLLLPSEVVHHKDGNKKNNHPDNLELFQSNAEHISQEHSGRPMSQEQKMKLSAAHKGKPKPKSEAHRAALSQALKGRTLSDETKRKLSEAARARPPKTAEQIERHSQMMRDYHQQNPEATQKAVLAMNAARRQQALLLRNQKDASTHQESESGDPLQR